MVNAEPTGVTRWLHACRHGDAGAFDRLVALLYDQLHGLAHRELLRGRPGVELQTTALVNELYLKLAGGDADWRDRGHFFAACATAMRRILVDEARRQMRVKRGGGRRPLTLDEEVVAADGGPEWLLRLDQLMTQLAACDSRLASVFECRYFGGYTVEETATALNLSKRTTERRWERSRAWLKHALDEG